MKYIVSLKFVPLAGLLVWQTAFDSVAQNAGKLVVPGGKIRERKLAGCAG